MNSRARRETSIEIVALPPLPRQVKIEPLKVAEHARTLEAVNLYLILKCTLGRRRLVGY
jgi:hypothetical protein